MVLGQTPAQDLERYVKKYPGEPRVILQQKSQTDISVGKYGNLVITYHDQEEVFYTNSSASQFAKEKVNYTESMPVVEIEAWTNPPGEKKYSKVAVKEYTTKDEFSSGVFHDDSKSKSFYFPSLTKGAKTWMNYTKNITKPFFMPGMYFGSYLPIETLEYSILVDEGVELELTYINTDAQKIPVTITQEKKRKRYTWKLNNIEKFDFESDGPSAQYYLPHIIPRIKSYQYKGQKKNVLNDLGDLHNWYYTLIKTVNSEPSDELKHIVDSLVTGKTTDHEKVKSIYYWVQDNIKYVAFEEGMEGFIPKEAQEVCNSKFGDCKGMSSIMHEMITEAGIEAHLTWIGSRDIPYGYREVPTPAVDNHMIVTYKENGNYYFLDATGGTVPIDQPTGFIQGKEALLHIDSGKYEVAKVPIMPYEHSRFIDTTEIELDPLGNITGSGIVHMQGFVKSDMRRVLRYKNKKEQRKYLDRILERGSNKFMMDSVAVNELNDRETDLVIDYQFRLEDYAKINKDEVYVNLSLDKLYADMELKSDREIDLELDYKSKNTMVTVFHIPDGYELDYLPENASFEGDQYGFSVNYTVEDGKVIQVFENYDDFILLNKEHFDNWNSMIKAMRSAYGEVVVLKKIP